MKREPKTDFPDSGKVMRARITTIQDCNDKAGFQHETKALDNLALFEAAFNIASDVDKTDPFRGFEPEFLAIAFH